MTNTTNLLARRKAAVTSGLAHVHPLFAERASNAEIWDVDGNHFIDFSSGIGVVNTGHLHPKVKAAVAAQLENFSHTCIHVVMYESYIELAERLNKLAPGTSKKKTLLINSGAEAIENATKIARKYTGRPGIIAFNGGFHGRTFLSMSLTGRVSPYKAGFGPFMPEIFHAPYPNALHGVSVDDALKGLEQLFKSDIEKERVGAFVIEPILGEGGFYQAPAEFMQALRKIANDNGIVLIVDEIQTGFGRSGKMFSIEHANIEPDLITMAKGLAGGFPLSAVVGKAEIMDAAPQASLGGTYGGNPIACAAANAVLDIMEEENILQKSQQIGQHMLKRLNKMASNYAFIADVRGVGSFIAIELCEGGDLQKPSAEKASKLQTLARQKGLILLSCGTNGNVIRFLPPLTIEQEILDKGLDIVEACLEQL